jgi:hypothetical protein
MSILTKWSSESELLLYPLRRHLSPLQLATTSSRVASMSQVASHDRASCCCNFGSMLVGATCAPCYCHLHYGGQVRFIYHSLCVLLSTHIWRTMLVATRDGTVDLRPGIYWPSTVHLSLAKHVVYQHSLVLCRLHNIIYPKYTGHYYFRDNTAI